MNALFDDGKHCMWKPKRFTQQDPVMWKPARYTNMFQKYAFRGKGALKHGEWILHPNDSTDVSIGRLLMA